MEESERKRTRSNKETMREDFSGNRIAKMQGTNATEVTETKNRARAQPEKSKSEATKPRNESHREQERARERTMSTATPSKRATKAEQEQAKQQQNPKTAQQRASERKGEQQEHSNKSAAKQEHNAQQHRSSPACVLQLNGDTLAKIPIALCPPRALVVVPHTRVLRSLHQSATWPFYQRRALVASLWRSTRTRGTACTSDSLSVACMPRCVGICIFVLAKQVLLY